MDIIHTRNGLRLSQHGVVISELRTSPGPTHSVFDILAALLALLAPDARIGVLGFAGGGMMAPLRALKVESVLHAVDLDRASYELFREHCPEWRRFVKWQQADALAWLRRQPPEFGLLLEDLSVPQDGTVFKPAISWSELPELIRARLRPDGIGVFNLLRPTTGQWQPELNGILRLFGTARIVELDDFENRILIVGSQLPAARELGRQLRGALRRLHSRQAGRLRLRTPRR